MDSSSSPSSEDKTIRQLIEEAGWNISRYRYPDMSELEERIYPIMRAYGMDISKDRLDSISISDEGIVNIQTSWSTLGCLQNEWYYIPISIFEAEDPIYTASLARLQNMHEKLLYICEESLKEYEENVAEAAVIAKEIERFYYENLISKNTSKTD